MSCCGKNKCEKTSVNTYIKDGFLYVQVGSSISKVKLPESTGGVSDSIVYSLITVSTNQTLLTNVIPSGKDVKALTINGKVYYKIAGSFSTAGTNLTWTHSTLNLLSTDEVVLWITNL